MTMFQHFVFDPLRNHYSPDAQTKFMEASSAYEVLSNEDKRQVYDREGEEVRPPHDVVRSSQGSLGP